MPLQIRRGSTADRLNNVPLVGELVFDTSTGAVFIGNGSTPGGLPVTEFSIQDARDVVVSMLGDNELHSGITFQTLNNKLVATTQVDLTNYIGLIGSDQGFQGSLWAKDSSMIVDADTGTVRGTFIGDLKGSIVNDDSTIPLVDGTEGTINLDSTIASDVIPKTNNAFDIGASGTKFKDLYLNSNIYLGSATIGSSGSAVSLPAGSTIGGNPISSTIGDIVGSVFPDDSALGGAPLVDGVDAAINLNGTIKDNVVPALSETYTLGTLSNKFSALYLKEGNNLIIGNAVIGSSSAIIELPLGSTVGGNPIASTSGSNATTITVNTTGTDADHFISFFDDQTGDNIIYTDDTFKYNPGTGYLSVGNATIGTVNGNVTGNLTGDVNGNVTGNLTGDVKATNGTTVLDSGTNGTDATFAGTVTGSLNGNVTATTGSSSFNNITIAGSFGAGTGNFSTSTYSNASSMFGFTQAHATADARNVTFARGRGTTTALTTVQNGDDIADIVFAGYGTSAYVSGAQISVTVEDASISNTSMKSKMAFSTNTGSGLVEHVSLDSTGLLNVAALNITPAGQTTVGAAGAASALPATPSTYFKIKVNGVEYVVPAYAVS